MKENQHVQAIPPDVLAQTQIKIQEVLTLFAPYLLTLTPQERRELPKMGEKTIGFVEKVHNFAQQNPNLVPPCFEMSAFNTDFTDAHGFWTLHNLVLQFGRRTKRHGNDRRK
jgi:hypothetical protein